MYGTVARMRVRRDRLQDLEREVAGYDQLDVPGFVGTYVYRMDGDETEYYMAVIFEDRESYHRNAQDPAQDGRFRKMRELLEEDPEWHDGEIVWSSGR